MKRDEEAILEDGSDTTKPPEYAKAKTQDEVTTADDDDEDNRIEEI